MRSQKLKEIENMYEKIEKKIKSINRDSEDLWTMIAAYRNLDVPE